METKKYVSNLKFLISQNKEQEVINSLLQNFGDSDIYDEIILISNSLKKFQSEQRMGIKSNEEYTKSSIILRLLNIINTIETNYKIDEGNEEDFLKLSNTIRQVRTVKFAKQAGIGAAIAVTSFGIGHIFTLGIGFSLGILTTLIVVFLIIKILNELD